MGPSYLTGLPKPNGHWLQFGPGISPLHSLLGLARKESNRKLSFIRSRQPAPPIDELEELTGDIHEEVENHNRILDRVGNDMDSSRGFLSGTVDKFKMVFETKSSRRMATMVASFIAVFLLIYYLTK